MDTLRGTCREETLPSRQCKRKAEGKANKNSARLNMYRVRMPIDPLRTSLVVTL